MRKHSPPSKELTATLTDLQSMAYLGRYYAAKIRAAADVAVFRAGPGRKEYHEGAVRHLASAVEQWESYTRLASGQYRAQLFSRTHYMDWSKLLEEVKKEVETVQNTTR